MAFPPLSLYTVNTVMNNYDTSTVPLQLLLAKDRQWYKRRFQGNTTFPNSFLCKVHVQTSG
jgi:hypothetical protein